MGVWAMTRINEILDRYIVRPGMRNVLESFDPDDDSCFPSSKKHAEKELPDLNNKLEALQELLYAGQKHRILIVLQAMDTGGKDGVIRHVFEGVNPQGVKVAGFKAPSSEEISHDYLWRIHRHTPGKGEIVIFNRSHYEDVLVVRVHRLVPDCVWKKRYEQINQFEKLLWDEGTMILKFYLHISRDEQKKRLRDRQQTPEKRWKFSLKDVEERRFWDDYMDAYEDVLRETSSEWAPWYVIPANRKWYRNYLIARIIIDRLESLDMKYPEPEEDITDIDFD